MIKKDFREDIYLLDWTLIISEKKEDEKEIIKLLKKVNCEVDGISDANGFTLHRNWQFIIILNVWKKNMKDLVYLLSVIRHEVHYLCADVYDAIGEDSKILDSESFLYFNDYIFRKILNTKAFRKVLDKIK